MGAILLSKEDHNSKAGLKWDAFIVLLVFSALAGLYIASRADGDVPYWGGLGLSIFCISGLFYSIAKVSAFK